MWYAALIGFKSPERKIVMQLREIFRYPVKGLSAEPLEAVSLLPGQCLPHDRRFALAQGDNPFDPAAPTWVQKMNFGCLAANARLALLRSAFDPATGILTLHGPDGGLSGDTATAEGRQTIAAWLTRYLGAEARGAGRFETASNHNFTDQPKKGVSLLFLSSLRALEQAAGVTLDPMRFRANFVIEGGAAWDEFAWVDRELQLGEARLRVFKRTVRCPATQVNPATGERDQDVPALLRQHFGHADLGIHAEVIAGGTVRPGDRLTAQA
jgi:uncharacterized protein YcbX